MYYEVEQKFPVGDLAAVEAKLKALGAVVSEPCSEIDTYYAHPARDFARTDEALRLRRSSAGSFITYKGPKVDATTKTRWEIDLPLAIDDRGPGAWASLLEALGFTPVAEVRKQRRKARVPWQDRQIETTLDEVADVGTFVELELTADAQDADGAKRSIASLAEALGLEDSERRSYLELLLHRRGSVA
jgi:adenylate cyclase class 2